METGIVAWIVDAAKDLLLISFRWNKGYAIMLFEKKSPYLLEMHPERCTG